MNKYTKAYLNIISEMNDQLMPSEELDFNEQYDRLCQGKYFLDNPQRSKSSENNYSRTGYVNYQEVIQDIQLSDRVVDVSVSQEVHYTYDMGYEGSREQPASYANLDEAYVETQPFYKDLNNIKNDQVLKIVDSQTREQIKFSELSMHDRFLIAKAIILNNEAQDWFQKYVEEIQDKLRNKFEENYRDYPDTDDYEQHLIDKNYYNN